MTEQEVKIKITPFTDVSGIRNSVDEIRRIFEKLQVNPKLKTSFKDIFTTLETSLDKVEKQVDSGIFDQKGLNNFKSGMSSIVGLFNQLYNNAKKIHPDEWAASFTADPNTIKPFTDAIKAAEQAQKDLISSSSQMASIKTAYDTARDAVENIYNAEHTAVIGTKKISEAWDNFVTNLKAGELNEANKNLKNIEKSLKLNSNTAQNAASYYKPLVDAFDALVAEYKKYDAAIDTNIQEINKAKAPTEGYEKTLETLLDVLRQYPELARTFSSVQEETAKSAVNASKSLDQLISRFEYFFSFTNAFRLLRRTITSAFNTVKELDEAMTETATVTEYSVGQMWDKLDEYTAIANKLGATTLGTYKTITLFFQQGLNEAQSLALATETMKMARVANIDYAEATQYMTSALRGFNMELNETSATRVNDVYSELAKITAADTQQIAIAMSKVASLANSANMELETTSALLSQIIETTQEAPETAGTALKTIIARFAEVKKLYTQGELTGQDEEGEEIDVNKVSVALRKAGINLNDFITGNKGLDEIFLELSKKWDSLDLVTQRYIATMAAGSRQQSRFIAMMQDYDRLIELTNAAYNSAGSGQEQFEKTLDSLKAKLNQLKNAWDSFTMSIANSDVLKTAVDGLTTLLTVVNKVTDAFGKASGAIKLLFAAGLAKIATIYAGNAFMAMRNYQGNDMLGKLAAGKSTFGASAQQTGSWLGGLFSPANTLQQQRDLKVLERAEFLNEKEANGNHFSDDDLKKAAKLNQEISTLDKQLASTNMKIKQVGASFQGLGIATTIAGAGITAFGKAIKNDALVSTGELISKVGALTLQIGTVTRFLPEIINGVKVMGATLGTTGMIALGVLGAVVIAVVTLSNHLQKLNQDFRTLDSQSNDALKDIQNNVNNLIDLSNELSESTSKNSLEWATNLRKVNQQYKELIDKYPQIKQFVQFDPATGTFKTLEGYEDYINKRTRDENLVAQASVLPSSFHSAGLKNAATGEVTYAQLNPRNLEGTTYAQLTPETINNIGNFIADFSKLYGSDTWQKANNFQAQAIVENRIRAAGVEDFELTAEQKEYNKNQLFDLLISVLQQVKLNEAIEAEGLSPNNRLGDKAGQNLSQTYANEEELLAQQKEILPTNEDANALKTYWESFDKLTNAVKEDEIAFNGLALEVSGALKYFKKLNEVVKDNQDILKNGTKSSTEYQIALGKIANEANELFGGQLDTTFVEKYKDQFIDAFVNGSDEAFDYIQQKAIEAFNISQFIEDGNYEFSDTIVNEVQDAINIIKEQMATEEFKMTGQADFTAVYQALMAAGHMTEETAAQIASDLLQAFALEAYAEQSEDGKTVRIRAANTGRFNAANLRTGSGKKSGGGSSKKEKAWENPYDQLYNLTERNEEAIRKRNILEKEYNAILRDRESAANELTKNSLQQLANLQEQLAYQKQLQAGRLKQINAVNNETWTDSEGNRKSYAAWDVTQYASYNQKTNTIEIDWDAIDKVTDETKGKAIEDYIKRLEELQKEFEKTDEDILDIEAEIDEINRRSKDDFLSLEQRVYDAIVKQHQEVIDAYSSFNDTLNDTNDKIMNGLREQIDLERQIRDNTKTEEDIAEKEARLAYLQRDTSGANATETLRLQKEIDDARQSYSDSLIDQQIDSIEKGNEKAAEQRQIQISMMQEQLDYWTKNGAFWSTVSSLLTNAIDPETGKLDKNNAALVSLLMDAENFGGLSEFGQMDWYDDLVEAFNKGMEGFGNFKMQQAEEAGEITQGGNTYKYDKSKKAWMLGGEAYSAVYDPVTGQYIFTRNKTEDVKTGTIGEPKEEVKAEQTGGTGYTGSAGAQKYKFSFANGDWAYSTVSTSQPDAVSKAISNYKAFLKKQGRYSDDMINRIVTSEYVQKFMTATKYAQGGFADYTGPAWLDGTKTKPEAVLNAKQTELFISLRDMLEKFGQTGGFTNSYGNTYVDLDVNADIGSDYDVDSLVSRLKRDILDSSSYRNVNMLSRGH